MSNTPRWSNDANWKNDVEQRLKEAELRLSRADLNQLSTDVDALESMRLLDIRRTPANGAEAYRAVANGWSFYQGPGDPALGLSYTPPVNAWWEVTLNVGLLHKLDAAYHYGVVWLNLAPADVDGVANAMNYESQHTSVQTFTGRFMTRTFKLAAGTAYTASAKFQTDGGSWEFYQGSNQLYMEAMAHAR